MLNIFAFHSVRSLSGRSEDQISLAETDPIYYSSSSAIVVVNKSYHQSLQTNSKFTEDKSTAVPVNYVLEAQCVNLPREVA